MAAVLLGQISTHTPARGVTDQLDCAFSSPDISTHTPARGVTGAWDWVEPNLDNFYSHAREGRDSLINVDFTTTGISTHTPARGVTSPTW